MAKIKFMQHYVTDGALKVKVSYHAGQNILDWKDGKPSRVVFGVTLYAKDYEHALATLFPEKYRNGSDLQSDYFEHGSVKFFPGDEHFAAALARAELNGELWDARRAKAQARVQARLDLACSVARGVRQKRA